MEHSEVLHILQPILGQWKRSTHKSGHENYAFTCPFCHHYKPKLEVDIASGNWHCWKCDAKGRTPYSLLKRLNVDKAILIAIRKRYRPTSDYIKPQTPSTQDSPLTLPKEFIPLSNPESGSWFQKSALRYLDCRNVTREDIERYRMGYCQEGSYDDKVIVPNYDSSGKLNYFVGRSYNVNSPVKFQSPSVEKDFIGFELYISWQFPVILCEGAFDAIAIRRNAIPLYGKTISKKLKEKIIQERPPRLYIALDPDAIKDIIKIAEYFVSNGIETYLVELTDGDPSEIGHDRFWKCLENAKKLEINDSFEMKMKMLL
jgi:DNA primase